MVESFHCLVELIAYPRQDRLEESVSWAISRKPNRLGTGVGSALDSSGDVLNNAGVYGLVRVGAPWFMPRVSSQTLGKEERCRIT